jgi:hypothetical protein
VPNQALASTDYKVVIDEERPLAERLAAFARRASWLTPLGNKSYTDQINNMIAHFDRMGVVEPRNGPKSGPFPPLMEVQDLQDVPQSAYLPDPLDLSGIEKMRRFPYGLRR